MNDIPHSSELLRLLHDATKLWAASGSPVGGDVSSIDALADLAVEIHLRNFHQWHWEAEVRRPDIGSEGVAELKRKIDRSNGQRHALIERFDKRCVERLSVDQSLDWSTMYINSETLGQLVDRISILVLRDAFTRQQANRRAATGREEQEAQRRLGFIAKQLEHVALCYDRFRRHLIDGTGFMLAYEPLKVYEG